MEEIELLNQKIGIIEKNEKELILLEKELEKIKKIRRQKQIFLDKLRKWKIILPN